MKQGDAIPEFTWNVTREQFNAYAEASGDRNPIHLDDSVARSVGLPGVIAHGMLGMAQMANAVVAFAGDHRRLRRLKCRFAGLVLPGDTVIFRGSVTEVVAGVARLELSADNQRGERVLSKALAELSV